MAVIDPKLAVYDDLIAAAQETVDSLESQRHAIEHDLEIRQLHLRLLQQQREEVARAGAPQNGQQTPMVSGGLPEQIIDVMREHGPTMRPAEMAKVLKGLGVTTKSKRGLLPMVISALRRRTDLFENVERGVYILKQETKEPAD